MSIVDLRALCVSRFPLSTTRDTIMIGVEQIVERLAQTKVCCEVWVNGSFMTEKIDPEDADLVLCLDGAVYEIATLDQRATIDWVNSNLKPKLRCDSYVFCIYPETHPLYWYGDYAKAYWTRQFGFSRGHEMKGIAVVKTC